MIMKSYFQTTTSAAPLAVFRIAFGFLIFGSIIRFWANGWIDELYIQPKHFFTYYGFEFVKPLGVYTYLLFVICGICALLVAIGLFYRLASIGLFLSFTYIELIDKSTYLNHYYFISMICLMMTLLPAHSFFSVDSARNKELAAEEIPRWCLDSLKCFVCIVYLFAGLAKINSDWLLQAQPLKIWLPAKNDLPVIGGLMNLELTAYIFSWMGCLYDLAIPFLLLCGRTRWYAYAAVVTFHGLTAILFPIGMFPYVMMATALIFFGAGFQKKILNGISKITRIREYNPGTGRTYQYPRRCAGIASACFALFLFIQILLPWRYLLYPGELFWTEQGYRFSWRVMLIEKAGYAQFGMRDATGTQTIVDNREFLTPLQEKMMSTQPDMMLQYAHMLEQYFISEGYAAPEIYVDSYVALNGRLGRPLVSPATDLAKEKDSFLHKNWLLPFQNEINGL